MCGIKLKDPVRKFSELSKEGAENTIMLIENPDLKSTDWIRDNDLTIDEAVALVQKIRPGQTLFVALYSGNALQIPHLDPQEFSAKDIRNLFDPRDGQSVAKIKAKMIGKKYEN